MLKIIIHLFIFAFLSILTQMGGVVYFAALYVSNKFQLGRVRSVGLFVIIYLITTFAIIPLIAPIFGRAALPFTGNLRPLNIATCLLNRHYVRPELKKQLTSVAEQMNRKFDGTRTNYLDANFPFYDGFPLFPHLSHNDIEPHLKKRWNLNRYDNIRFHGCQAVRHDDHIHTQIKNK